MLFSPLVILYILKLFTLKTKDFHIKFVTVNDITNYLILKGRHFWTIMTTRVYINHVKLIPCPRLVGNVIIDEAKCQRVFWCHKTNLLTDE